ncbi:MAG: PQQ-binding-like beta-propeller repeat protein, partial [Longimicrobiales bacterium]
MTGGWTAYGGDPGGMRFSPLSAIDRGNVARLEPAWTYRTGDIVDPAADTPGTRFEATPIVVWETLYFSTPFNRVIALDPETGKERWVFDPGVDLTADYSEDLISRGVSAWEDPDATAGAPCARRIFLGAMDARLFALDAATGRPCDGFGEAGMVELKTPEVGEIRSGQYMLTSPPAIVDGAVVVGSAIGDNRMVEMERGIVRGYDARSGELLWMWDPVPRTAASPAWSEWQPEDARVTGAANAWSIISADTARGLVFVPTGSASPDFWGGRRRGSNRWANSVIAIRARTGDVVWGFQVVHHDLWDYDVASQPLLTDLEVDGRTVPVVVQATKMGHVFVLHRETGEPVFPVEERAVPASDVPGETAWPTQPFPTHPAPLHPTTLRPEDAFGTTDADRTACRDAIAALRYEGIFTPPSLQGTIVYPSFVGGMNWGSAAFAPPSNTLVVLLNRFPFWVKLLHRDSIAAFRAQHPEAEIAQQEGAAFAMARAPLMG